PPPLQAPLRRAGRRAPAGPADLALRLLLRHSDWWERLSPADHELLHGFGGVHGEAVAWLERQLTEHGPQTWAALDEALAPESWADAARAWVASAAADEEQGFEDLQRVMQRLWVEHLGQQAQALVEAGATTADDLQRLRALHEQIARLKAALAASGG
ncbi:hypothetical protein IP87_19335, partial [beta proteobacterium AAP121]